MTTRGEAYKEGKIPIKTYCIAVIGEKHPFHRIEYEYDLWNPNGTTDFDLSTPQHRQYLDIGDDMIGQIRDRINEKMNPGHSDSQLQKHIPKLLTLAIGVGISLVFFLNRKK